MAPFYSVSSSTPIMASMGERKTSYRHGLQAVPDVFRLPQKGRLYAKVRTVQSRLGGVWGGVRGEGVGGGGGGSAEEWGGGSGGREGGGGGGAGEGFGL